MEKKNRVGVLLSFCFFTITVFGQVNHEPVFTDLEGDELYNVLVDNYRPEVVLPYSEARDTLFSKIDAVNDSLECAYTGMKLYLNPNADPTTTVFMNGADNGINTEHSYPQSKGAGDGNARSDMHHLYPTRVKTNADRGSKIFADSPDNLTSKWYRKMLEQNTTPGENIDEWSELGNNVFEPRESYKGNVARSLMYFYTMYREEANDADPEFFGLQQETLCDWHFDDPVDQVEWERTHKIAMYQEDKPNPFVLDCSVASRIYCNEASAECILVDIDTEPEETLYIYPNPAYNILNIEGLTTGKAIVSDVMGNSQTLLITSGKIDIQHLRKGMYFISVNRNGTRLGSVFLKN